jgi:hypothetical protein
MLNELPEQIEPLLTEIVGVLFTVTLIIAVFEQLPLAPTTL